MFWLCVWVNIFHASLLHIYAYFTVDSRLTIRISVWSIGQWIAYDPTIQTNSQKTLNSHWIIWYFWSSVFNSLLTVHTVHAIDLAWIWPFLSSLSQIFFFFFLKQHRIVVPLENTERNVNTHIYEAIRWQQRNKTELIYQKQQQKKKINAFLWPNTI